MGREPTEPAGVGALAVVKTKVPFQRGPDKQILLSVWSRAGTVWVTHPALAGGFTGQKQTCSTWMVAGPACLGSRRVCGRLGGRRPRAVEGGGILLFSLRRPSSSRKPAASRRGAPGRRAHGHACQLGLDHHPGCPVPGIKGSPVLPRTWLSSPRAVQVEALELCPAHGQRLESSRDKETSTNFQVCVCRKPRSL